MIAKIADLLTAIFVTLFSHRIDGLYENGVLAHCVLFFLSITWLQVTCNWKEISHGGDNYILVGKYLKFCGFTLCYTKIVKLREVFLFANAVFAVWCK